MSGDGKIRPKLVDSKAGASSTTPDVDIPSEVESWKKNEKAGDSHLNRARLIQLLRTSPQKAEELLKKALVGTPKNGNSFARQLIDSLSQDELRQVVKLSSDMLTTLAKAACKGGVTYRSGMGAVNSQAERYASAYRGLLDMKERLSPKP